VKFGCLSCFLSKQEAEKFYDECVYSLKISIDELKNYSKTHKDFEKIGQRMIDVWSLSLDQKTYKELPDEIVRNW